jgi:uncharacterized membrane protein
MLDLSLFRKPTFLGANIAHAAFSSCLLTMLTFMPIFFQHSLRLPPQTAGLYMLPMALPLFFVPRLVNVFLSHHLSGRALLTIGLSLVSTGLGVMSWGIQHGMISILLGMFIAGAGAGILNGETTKVGMTAVEPERAGMASGIAGTVRFTSIVLGFAALGAALVGRISQSLQASLPLLDPSLHEQWVRAIAAGNLSVAGAAAPSGRPTVAALAFQSGYQSILCIGCVLCTVAMLATWLLVRTSDTRPLSRSR